MNTVVFGAMRTTIDIPDTMLRRVKSKCALEGRTMRGVTLSFFQNWLDGGSAAAQIVTAEPPRVSTPPSAVSLPETPKTSLPAWFGIAASHIRHDVPHDMESIRASIAKGRKAEWEERERRIREGAK